MGGGSMGCFSRKKSSDSDGSVRMRETNGMCCLPRFNSSGESYREEGRTSYLGCKRGKCGLSCFYCDKPLGGHDSLRKRRKCGMACFCSHKNSLEGESSKRRRRKGKCGVCCFFAKGSSKVEDLSMKRGGCFDCCKSSHDEESRRGEKVTCCCYHRRGPRENDLSPRGGCSYWSICVSKKKKKNKSNSRRLCWRTKDAKRTNHLPLVKNNSFSADNENLRCTVGEILHLCNINIAARVFKLCELAEATQNFSAESLLGQGPSGRVYKGQLQDTNQILAVKKLNRNEYQGNREFLIEVLMLSLLNHNNLVNLLGYCIDREERILVYDYMPLGSLQDHLHDRSRNGKPLSWNARMKIAAGAAKGLEYLHDIANPPVIYRDLKASNVLLDEDFTPKLSDFGLAKTGSIGDKKYISTRVMGAYGYCAPEYAITGKLTKMSDVYSFGVMLLELITGRKPMDKNRPLKEQLLVEWAMPLFKDKKKFAKIADPLLEGNFPLKSLFQTLAIASQCLQEKASTRPVIRDIVDALEYLAGQNSSISPDEGSTPQIYAESELKICLSEIHEEFLSPSQSDNDWISCSANNEDETKLETVVTEDSSSASSGGAKLLYYYHM